MRELPAFSGDEPTCQKCSHEGALALYKDAERLGASVLTPERLQRVCARCGYTWDEALNPPDPDVSNEEMGEAVQADIARHMDYIHRHGMGSI